MCCNSDRRRGSNYGQYAIYHRRTGTYFNHSRLGNAQEQGAEAISTYGCAGRQEFGSQQPSDYIWSQAAQSYAAKC